MDHVVYVDAKEKELERLLSGSSRMVVRGASGRKLPYGRVQPGDRLYFTRNNGEGLIRAWAQVTEVVNSDRLGEDESRQMLLDHQDDLQLTPAMMNRWGGKRYLVLVRIGPVSPLEPFAFDRSAYGNMDDWLPVGEIEQVRRGA